MAFGELNINYDATTGGVFYKDSTGKVIKAGPAQVSATAPNSTPAGSAGNSPGEIWFDTASRDFKIWDGFNWLVASEEGNPVGRMHWDGNTTITDITAANTYRQFATSTRSLGAQNSEFALNPTHVGLNYTGLATRRMVVTMFGRYDSGPNKIIRFAVAKADTGTPNPPTDLLTDSVATTQDSKVSDVFITETVALVGPDNLIYPVVANGTDATDVTIRSLSFLVKKI
jgi:hypothetical protein